MLHRGPALLTIAAIVGGPMAPSAQARTWPNSGGWSIGQLSDSCGLSQTFEGEGATELILLLGVDGEVTLGLTNYNWSTVERQDYQLTYVLNGREFSGGRAVGYRDGARKGFLTRFTPDFLEHFASGAGLEVYNGRTLVDNLSLAGSGAGVATLRRCVAVVRAEVAAAERERARLAHIPRDPFANAAPTPPAPLGPTPARGNLGSFISSDDYPASSIRNREEGTTSYRLTIGPDGRATDCRITLTSGYPALDQATCRIVRSRARFTPARDAEGRPTVGTIESRVSWRLPEEELPPITLSAPDPPPAHPSRVWVQIAVVPESGSIQQELASLRTRAGGTIRGRPAYSAPFGRSSTRLLVGPFENARSAQDFVTQMGRANISAFAWTSEAGQVVRPLADR